MALDEPSAFDIWWNFVGPFAYWAHDHCRSAENAILRHRLPPLDWELYVITVLTGMMENCGSFADAAGAYPEDEQALRNGLTRFGCPKAASVLRECISLKEDFERAEGWTNEFQARHDAIESKEDWSYPPPCQVKFGLPAPSVSILSSQT